MTNCKWWDCCFSRSVPTALELAKGATRRFLGSFSMLMFLRYLRNVLLITLKHDHVFWTSECEVCVVKILLKRSSYKTTLLVVYILLALTRLD